MQKNAISAFLDAIPEPAVFTVRGSVTAMNPPAKGLGIQIGMNMKRLLDPFPDCALGETVFCNVWFLGRETRIRCSRMEGGMLLARAEAFPRPDTASIPSTVFVIRNAEQDLGTAIDLIAEEPPALADPVAKHTALARRSLYRLERIAFRLEWYYQLAEQTFHLQRQPVELSEQLDRLCEAADDLLQYRGQRLSYSGIQNECWIASVDRRLFEMLFWETVTNLSAVSGKQTIDLQIERRPPNTLQMTFSVASHEGDVPAQTEYLCRAETRNISSWAADPLGLGLVSLGAKAHEGRFIVSHDQAGGIRAVLTIPVDKLPANHLAASVFFAESGMHPGLVLFSELMPTEAFDLRDLG